MKKFFIIFAATLVSFVACQEEMAPVQDQENIETEGVEVDVFDYPVKVTFNAGSEDVKTSINDTKVLWEAGDEIKVLWSKGGYNKAKAEPYNENTAATFNTSVEEADSYYAVHPYAVESSYSDGNIVVTIPSVQGGTFADANIAVAKATEENLFRFKHLVGMICFTTDTPGKVIISGVEDDILTGVVTVTRFNDEDGTPVYDEDRITNASNAIEIDASASGTYYAAFLPSAKLTYLSIKVDEGDAVQYALSPNQMQMARGKIWDLGNISPRLGKNLFVTPNGTDIADGKTWETAMSYQQMAVMMAWNRDAIEKDAKTLVSSAGPAVDTEAGQIHNTVHADQMDGVTFHLSEGTYKPTAYIRMSWVGLDRKVNIKVLGGYSSSAKGTDLSKKGGETIVDSKDITKSTKRPFYLKDNINILFQDITFKSGQGDGEHGAATFFILPASNNTPSVLTCNNCKFIDNTSDSRGVIYQYGAGNVNLNDCEFVGNKAKGYGASVAMLTANGVLSANRCKFSGNGLENSSDNSCFGGALFVEGTARLKDCEFEANYIKNSAVNKAADAEAGTEGVVFGAFGGSIHGTATSDITISGCSFKDGYAEDADTEAHGGEIHTFGKLAVNDTDFERTTSRTDVQAYKGGAIFLQNAELSLQQTRITNCSATYNAGAVYLEAGSKLTATGCTFTGNSVTESVENDHAGGAVFSTTNAANSMIFSDCDFINNDGSAFGGAIACYSPNLIVKDGCNFIGNKTSSRKSGVAYGGALYLSQKATNGLITSSTFTDNYALNSYGSAYGGAIQVHSGSSATISSCVFTRSEGNTDVIANRGGAIVVSGGTVAINGISVSGYSVKDYGGAIYTQEGATVTMTGANIFTGCSANRGGAISLNAGTTADLSGAEILSSSATWGGAIYCTDQSDVTLSRSKVEKCYASTHAGGILSEENSYLTLSDVDFIENEGQEYGGAISYYNKTLTIKDGCTFVRNRSTKRNGIVYGAVYLAGSSKCNIDGATFIDNIVSNSYEGKSADAYGASIYVNSSSSATITNAVFSRSESNTGILAQRGGAIGVNGCTLTLKGNVTFQNCSAANFGGAIYLQGASTMNADNSLFAKNSVVSGDRAGAVAVYGTSKIYMNQCVFEENVATKYGAAVGCETNKAVSCFFNNCVFRGNNGKTNSNAVYYKGGVLGMNNCTAYNNAASGSDINFSDGTSGTSGIILNSTILSKATNCITNYMGASNAKGVSVLNSIMLCSGKVSTSATGITSSGYNYISTGLTSATGDVVVASGSADLTSFTQVGDNPWFSWNAASVMTSSIGLSEIETEVKKNVSGEAFLTWLKGLTVRTTSGTASNALLYDIAGNSRGESYTPGSFQISE